MKDNRHRNYDYIPEVSKQTITATDLLNEIRWFIKNIKTNHEDWIVLWKLIKNLEQNTKQSNKVLRSMTKRFTNIQQKYQKQKG